MSSRMNEEKKRSDCVDKGVDEVSGKRNCVGSLDLPDLGPIYCFFQTQPQRIRRILFLLSDLRFTFYLFAQRTLLA